MKIRIILEPETGGGYHAFCPLLKGCHSCGGTKKEALANIKEAVELYLRALAKETFEIKKKKAVYAQIEVAA